MSTAPEHQNYKPNEFDVIVVGHANVDIFFTLADNDPDWRLNAKTNELAFKYGEKIAVKDAEYAMGGNGQNVAVGLARLGYKVALLEEIGGDAFAQDIVKNLTQNHVSTDYLVKKPEKRTSIGVVMNVKGDRTILSQHVVHKHELNLDNVAPRLIYLTSLGPVWEDAYEQVLNFAAERQVPIAFNPGSSQLNQQNDIFWRAVKQSHILCVNLDEARTMLQSTNPKASLAKLSVQQVMEKVSALGPKIVVVTDGKNGSFARAEDGRCFQQDILPAPVLERTGAGDSFTAGVLGAALSGKSLQQAMYWGAKNASSVVGRIGSQPGLLTRDQMESDLDPLLVGLGYDRPIAMLQFDQQDELAIKLFGKSAQELSNEERVQIQDAKLLIYEAVIEAIRQGVPRDEVVIGIDSGLGEKVIEQATKDHISVALTAGTGNEKAFALTNGDHFKDNIETVNPTFVAASVKYNPSEPIDSRKEKKAALKALNDFCRQNQYKFILELNPYPTKKQAEQFKGDIAKFAKDLQPEVAVKAILEFHQVGIEPDVWQVVGGDNGRYYQMVAKEARSAEFRQGCAVVIASGAQPDESFTSIINHTANIPGVTGFTAGMPLFAEAVVDFVQQNASRQQAKNRIAQEFLHLYQTYRSAKQVTIVNNTSTHPEPSSEKVTSKMTSGDGAEIKSDWAAEADKASNQLPVDNQDASIPKSPDNPFQAAPTGQSTNNESSDSQTEPSEPIQKRSLLGKLFKR